MVRNFLNSLLLSLILVSVVSAQDKKLNIPDECLAKKDTFEVTDRKEPRDRVFFQWETDNKGVWIWDVGNREMLVMHYHTGKDSPPVYILGVFVKHKAVTHIYNTYLYVEIKNDCKLRDAIVADLKKQLKREVYWF